MRKTILLVLLALVALAPTAGAQPAPRGYYDQYGQWHANETRTDGYYDTDGVWHPNDGRSGGYYDRNGQWHAYGNDRYERAGGPQRWTYSDNRGRAEALSTAARNLASTATAIEREAYRRSGYSDRAALEALRRLAEQAQHFAQVTQQRTRGDLAGQAYASLVDSYFAARDRFGALQPDARMSNQLHVLSQALGRIDKRYFGNRAFGGQSPASMSYGYGRDSANGYDQYGNPRPGYDRDGRDTRPYPY